VTHGLINGNSIRFLLLEILASSWPLLSFAVLQAFGPKDFRFVLVSLALIGLAQATLGLTALQITGQRLGGVFFTTIPAMVAVVLWIFATLTERRALRIASLVVMVPLILHLFFSFTRGYWLAFLVAMIVATLLAWRSLARTDVRSKWRPARMLAGLLVVGALATAVSIIYTREGNILDTASRRFTSAFRVEAADRQTASNIFRLIEYAEAVRLGLDSPVLGHGYGAVISTEDPFLGIRSTQWFVHNYYLLAWFKLGAVGLLAFGILILTLLRSGLKAAARSSNLQVRVLAISAVSLTIQVLVVSLTNFNFAMIPVAFFLAFVWGVFWAVAHGGRETAA
jgi:O-antigen ligase